MEWGQETSPSGQSTGFAGSKYFGGIFGGEGEHILKKSIEN
jgi:hypothetical protein